MKKYMLPIFALGLSFCLFAFAALAQAPSPSPSAMPDPLAPQTTDLLIQFLLASIGGVKGAGALGIAALVVQALLRIANWDLLGGLWGKIPGFWKLITVMVLSYASGVLSLVAQGVSVGAALIHSTVLASVMVLGNQLYKQWDDLKSPKKP